VPRIPREERLIQEIRPSGAVYMNGLDFSGMASQLAILDRAPWRFIIVGGAVAAAAIVTESLLLLCAGIALAFVLGILEAWHRRDYLTSTRLVRQSGVLGRRRQELPLAQIERVEFSYPRFGRFFNAGDVEVVGPGQAMQFFGVHDPEALADTILRARQALLATTAGSNG